jgi:3-oxoadipate enol-lactonase
MPHASTALGRWWYEDLGGPSTGPAIVLLHGLMLDRSSWAAHAGSLAQLGRVLVFDGPGHGRSDPPPAFDLDANASALVDALDAAGVERAVLVGHSWGGLVALRVAARRGERVAGLVAIAASIEPEPPARRAEYEAYVAAIRLIGIPRWFVRARIAGIVYGAQARRTRPDLADGLHETMIAHPRAGFLRAALAVIRRPRLDDDLGRVRVPTLVACGRDDRTMPPFRSLEIARAIPGARFALLDAGHSPHVERPDQVGAVLLPFVRACVESERPSPPADAPARGGTAGSSASA